MLPIREHQKNIKQLPRKKLTENTIIVEDLSTSLTAINRSSKQKINKQITDTLNQLDIIDIYRAFHFKTPDYTFFSNTHGIFSGIDYVMGHKLLSKI